LKISIPEAFDGIQNPWRFKVFYGGRGGGKSETVARFLLAMAMHEPLRILCTRELQASINDSVHKLLSDIIRSEPALSQFYEVLQTTIRGKNGTEFLFKGLKHNITEIKGISGIDRVWVEEAENISDRSWELLIPSIRKDGSEIWVIFNPRNISDPTYQRFIVTKHDDALVKKINWHDNPFFPAVLDKERKRLFDSDREAYEHIWGGNLDTRRSGAVYANQLEKARQEGRVSNVPYDPAYEVFTAWDLGFADCTSIWWLQFVGRELRWLEYYENSGEQIDHYVRIVKEKQYNYSMHYLPHDGGAGNIRGDSISKQLQNMGLKNKVLDRETDTTPGIELLRQTIGYSCFDANKCRDGIKALENHAYIWNEERAIFSKNPRHDWTSHGSDAARYAAIAAQKIKGGLTKKPEVTFVAPVYGAGSWMS